MHLRISNTGKQ